MNRTRLVPLIVATALFMENTDSTVIATSLPAIAESLNEDPVALKLALTSYLVSLAIFMPVSGWMADRYGARTVFRAALAVFMAGSLACARCGIARRLRRGALPPGHGRRHDGAGRPARAPAQHPEERDRRGARLSDHSGDGRAGGRPAARRLHHDLFRLALDLLHQHPDRASRHRALEPLLREHPRARAPAARRRRLRPVGRSVLPR